MRLHCRRGNRRHGTRVPSATGVVFGRCDDGNASRRSDVAYGVRQHRIKRVRGLRSLRTPWETRPEPRRLREQSTFEDTRGIGKDDPERPPTSNRAAFPASAQAGPHEPARSTSSDHLKGMVLDFQYSWLITQSLSQFFECFLFPSRHSLRR